MGTMHDPFEPLAADESGDEIAILRQVPAKAQAPAVLTPCGAAIGRLNGFALDESPLVSHLEALPGQVIAARTTVSLRRHMIGSPVVILYEGGDPHLPIVVGVIQHPSIEAQSSAVLAQPVALQADGARYEISAEREIVLSCGDSSITLTRAGKVIIKGKYILSRSTGYNKIKGAAVDIN